MTSLKNVQIRKSTSELIQSILPIEGQYVHHKKDLGGATNFGITEKLARAYGYEGDMRDLTWPEAEAIYYLEFIKRPNFDAVEDVSWAIARELFEIAINIGNGPHNASCWLQRLLNVANLEGKLYNDLTVDGKIGNVTISALKKFLDYRKDLGVQFLLKGLNCVQGHYYLCVAEAREASEVFILGWLTKRIEI